MTFVIKEIQFIIRRLFPFSGSFINSSTFNFLQSKNEGRKRQILNRHSVGQCQKLDKKWLHVTPFINFKDKSLALMMTMHQRSERGRGLLKSKVISKLNFLFKKWEKGVESGRDYFHPFISFLQSKLSWVLCLTRKVWRVSVRSTSNLHLHKGQHSSAHYLTTQKSS